MSYWNYLVLFFFCCLVFWLWKNVFTKNSLQTYIFVFYLFIFFFHRNHIYIYICHIEIIWLWKMFLQKIFCKITFLFFIISDCTKLLFCYLFIFSEYLIIVFFSSRAAKFLKFWFSKNHFFNYFLLHRSAKLHF